MLGPARTFLLISGALTTCRYRRVVLTKLCRNLAKVVFCTRFLDSTLQAMVVIFDWYRHDVEDDPNALVKDLIHVASEQCRNICWSDE